MDEYLLAFNLHNACEMDHRSIKLAITPFFKQLHAPGHETIMAVAIFMHS